MKCLLALVVLASFVLAALSKPVPRETPPPPMQEKIDLSGEWESHQWGKMIITQTGPGIRCDNPVDVSEGGAFGLLKGRVLHLQLDYVPLDGDYRCIARLELIGGELVGCYGQSHRVKFTKDGKMEGEIYRLKFERVKPKE